MSGANARSAAWTRRIKSVRKGLACIFSGLSVSPSVGEADTSPHRGRSHFARKLLEIREYSCVVFVQTRGQLLPDEKSDCAIHIQSLCGAALGQYRTKIVCKTARRDLCGVALYLLFFLFGEIRTAEKFLCHKKTCDRNRAVGHGICQPEIIKPEA